MRIDKTFYRLNEFNGRVGRGDGYSRTRGPAVQSIPTELPGSCVA